jgi:hypothetical protein
MSVGAKYTFEKAEVYWPQDSDSADEGKIHDLVRNPEPVKTGIEPQFQASADLDILVTLEANIGIQVGGISSLGGVTLVDSRVDHGNNTLRFHADANAVVSGDSGGASGTLAYNYGVYLLYNFGYGGHASVLLYSWYIQPRNLFSTPKSVTLYSNGDVLSTKTASSGTKRSLLGMEGRFHEHERGALSSDDASELTKPRTILAEARAVGIEDNVLWGTGPELVNVSGQASRVVKRLSIRQSDGDGDTEMTDASDSPDFSLAQGADMHCQELCFAGKSQSQQHASLCEYSSGSALQDSMFFACCAFHVSAKRNLRSE